MIFWGAHFDLAPSRDDSKGMQSGCVPCVGSNGLVFVRYQTFSGDYNGEHEIQSQQNRPTFSAGENFLEASASMVGVGIIPLPGRAANAGGGSHQRAGDPIGHGEWKDIIVPRQGGCQSWNV